MQVLVLNVELDSRLAQYSTYNPGERDGVFTEMWWDIWGFERVPLYKIHLESDLVSSIIVVGLTDNFPFMEIHLFLSNDLAGDMLVCKVLLNIVSLQMARNPFG